MPLRIRYQTFEFDDVDIHLRTLRDRQQFRDVDGAAEKLGVPPASWPLFGVVWESSEVLAHLMNHYEVAGKRILEVGCGIGLASLMLNSRHADITATDYNPEAETFLSANVKLNDGRAIPFVRTGWGDRITALGRFDLIIGSDLLYERDNVELLSNFIDQHAKPHCEVLVIDPGRGLHGPFARKMERLGYASSRRKPTAAEYPESTFKGSILRYQR